MIPATELTDGVVTLRLFRLADAPGLYSAVRESLAELKPWMSFAHEGYSLNGARDFIQIARAGWEEQKVFAFAITDTKTGEILGGISLSHIHPVYHLCNLGYWVRTARHGEGLAGRAALLIARFGFEQGLIIRAEIVMAIGNHQSRRVAEKIGAHYEGILLNRMVVDKAIYDAHMFSLLPSDFGLGAQL